MKILVVSNMYPSDKDPVYGTFVKVFFDGIVNRNIAGRCELVAIRGKRHGVIAKMLAYIKFYSSLTWNLLINDYDLVYVHTVTFPILPIRFASWFKRLPLAFNVHGDDVLPQTHLKKWLKKLAIPVLPKAKVIISPSEYFKKVLVREFPEVKNDNIFVSPSGGVDRRFFVKKQDDASIDRPLVLGYVSRIDSGKGWDLFVKAVSRLRADGIDCKGVMAGRGAESQKLLDMIQESGLNDCITYLGAVEQDKLPEIYSTFDLFVFPTMREAESLGLVGLEAMAAGTPVVAGNIGGPAGYIVDGVNGYLFAPGDSEDLVSKIHTYLSLDRVSRSDMSLAARNTAITYRSDTVNDKLYSKLTAINQE